MKWLKVAMALCFSVLALGTAQAQSKPAGYPDRPINLVVAYPPGGGMDITARTLAAQMERVTGYQFRVENRGGGGGIIGNTYVATQARPDGYTVGILANPTMFVNILYKGAHFTKSDVVPIAGINFAPVIWVVRTKSKFGKMDFSQILAFAKKHPGTLKVGVIPNATFDMTTRIIEKQTGTKFNMVPFAGGKPAVVQLLGGNIDMAANYYSEVRQYVADGSLKVVAVANNEPLADAPSAMTMKQLHIKMASNTWGADRFAAVPKGTPKPVGAYLSHLIMKTLADKQTQAAFEKVGIRVEAQNMAEKQKAYNESYAAVREYLKENGLLKKAAN